MEAASLALFPEREDHDQRQNRENFKSGDVPLASVTCAQRMFRSARLPPALRIGLQRPAMTIPGRNWQLRPGN
jgi:hypothetical protein